MPNWCSEFVTFRQEDGETDRLELLANDLKRIYEVENRITEIKRDLQFVGCFFDGKLDDGGLI